MHETCAKGLFLGLTVLGTITWRISLNRIGWDALRESDPELIQQQGRGELGLNSAWLAPSLVFLVVMGLYSTMLRVYSCLYALEWALVVLRGTICVAGDLNRNKLLVRQVS